MGAKQTAVGINVNKLRAKIVEHGLSVQVVADRLGVNRSTLYRKMQDVTGDSFTVGEVQTLSRILQLTPQDITDIFFSHYVA